MGLFDLPAPILAAVDQVFSTILPAGLRLAFWGVLSGWLTMLLFRRLSRQEAIAELKAAQKKQQDEIARFEGDFGELMPIVRQAFALGFRQLGLSIGPALLATIPILFIVAWVATTFVYKSPEPGTPVSVTAEPERGQLEWSDNASAEHADDGWTIHWPRANESITLSGGGGAPLLTLSSEELAGVIHKYRWWNVLIGNPAGYLPDHQPADVVGVELPRQQFLAFGPDWMRGWMFVFFGAYLLASIAFKFVLKIE